MTTTATTPTTFHLMVNRATVHIDGLAERSKGSEFNYALSPCSALSRGASRFERRPAADRIGDVIRAAELNARVNGRKVCKNCLAAAQAALAAEITLAELDAHLFARAATERNTREATAAAATLTAAERSTLTVAQPHQPATLNAARQPRTDGLAYVAGRKAGASDVAANDGDWLKLGVLLDSTPHREGPSAWWAWDHGHRSAILDHLRGVAEAEQPALDATHYQVSWGPDEADAITYTDDGDGSELSSTAEHRATQKFLELVRDGVACGFWINGTLKAGRDLG